MLESILLTAVFSVHRHAVVAGDTLSGLAETNCHNASDWTGYYADNRRVIGPDPNKIYPGQVLSLGRCTDPPRLLSLASATTDHEPDGDGDDPVAIASDGHDDSDGGAAASQPVSGDHEPDGDGDESGTTPGTDNPAAHSGGGFLSYTGLENLWVSAGGNPGAEATAACIAEHESGGNQYATGPYGERGYWQINPVNGSLSTYDPYGNARAAIILSHNGSDWSAWTTAPMCGV